MKDELMFTFCKWIEILSKPKSLSKMTDLQLLAFEEIVMRLIQWWKDANPNKDFEKDNDLSILKVLKLHFFVCAVGTKKNKESPLLDLFSFSAMPYGHVCKEVYEQIKINKGVFDKFTINNNRLTLNK